MIPEGYKFQTTFWQDFTIADAFGVNGIKETYNRAHNQWKDNVAYYKELVCVLNWKCWDWNEKDNEKSNCYCQLYEKAYAFGCSHFKGAEVREYLDFLDQNERKEYGQSIKAERNWNHHPVRRI